MQDNVNSKEYWNERFNEDWETNAGRQQTTYFGKLAISMFPKEFKRIINENSLSILDWGCAEGDGTRLLEQEFPKSSVSGLDFAEAAITKAKTYYPKIDFISGSLLEYNKKYDIIFTSNCLEHYEDPKYWLLQLMDYSNDFVAILIPFQEINRLKEHFTTFDYNSFNYKIQNFFLIYHQEIKTDPDYWPGKQILLIFQKESSRFFSNMTLEMYRLNDAIETDQETQKIRRILEAEPKLHAQIDEISKWANNLKNELTRIQSNLDQTTENLENQETQYQLLQQENNGLKEEYRKLNKIKQENEELKNKIKQENEELKNNIAHLHLELMKMGEWTKNLNHRLNFIDNSFILRNLEKFKRHSIKQISKKISKHIVSNFINNQRTNKLKETSFEPIKDKIKNSEKKVLIVFPVIEWDFRWQRPQHIVSQFAKDGNIVLYINMNFSVDKTIYQTNSEAIKKVSYTVLNNNIYQLNLSAYSEMNIYNDFINNENFDNILMQLNSVFNILKIQNPYYLIHFPGWSRLVFELKKKYTGKIVFDCMDDHAGFASNSKESLILEENLVQEADLVIASSEALYNKVSLHNNKVSLIRNGTEFNQFNNLDSNLKLADFKKPIIGYYGAISDWFDIELLQYCAEQKPDWSFIMIGSTWGATIDEVSKLENVHFLGEKKYTELPGYLADFDVCTIPFKIIPLTLATNPVKFYEYISSGKPVVSVKLPELEQYKEFCYLADTKEQFLKSIEQALFEKKDSAIIDSRINLAKQNSWHSRYIEIKKVLESFNS